MWGGRNLGGNRESPKKNTCKLTYPSPTHRTPRKTMLMSRIRRPILTPILKTNRRQISDKYCSFRVFAKTHPEAARLVLIPPAPSQKIGIAPFDIDKVNCKEEALEQYLEWRGWDVSIKRILDEHDIQHEYQSAVGLVSHPLTFPLTLGRHIQHLVQQPNQNDGANGQETRISRLCCVGARSECTLPDDFWREFLVMTSAKNTLDMFEKRGERADQTTSYKLIIDFVGPDVPNQIKTKHVALSDQDTTHSTQHSLTMNYHTSFLHELVLQLFTKLHTRNNTTANPVKNSALETMKQFWDGFVLFNPGLGHPNLSKDWESTIKFLSRTSKPILLTAHSSIDACRDSSVLQDRRMVSRSAAEIEDGYQLNPYASRMEFVDPFTGIKERVHVVRPNHSSLLIHGRT